MISPSNTLRSFILITFCCAGSLHGQVSYPAHSVQDQLRQQMTDLGPRFAAPAESSPRSSQARSADFGSNTYSNKSAATALLLSAALPGAGQYYLGHRSRARYFFTGEVLSWIGYASFRMFGHWRENDLIRFARERAGANLTGKSERFQDMVGFYWDIDQYNSLGRAFDPQRAYYPDTPDNHWRWQDPDDQIAYRLLKNRSREAFTRARFMIIAMVVNRAISVIDTYRELRHRQHGKANASSLTDIHNYALDFDPLATKNQITLTWYAPF